MIIVLVICFFLAMWDNKDKKLVQQLEEAWMIKSYSAPRNNHLLDEIRMHAMKCCSSIHMEIDYCVHTSWVSRSNSMHSIFSTIPYAWSTLSLTFVHGFKMLKYHWICLVFQACNGNHW